MGGAQSDAMMGSMHQSFVLALINRGWLSLPVLVGNTELMETVTNSGGGDGGVAGEGGGGVGEGGGNGESKGRSVHIGAMVGAAAQQSAVEG